MSRILVSYATRTGTTWEVATALAAELSKLGHDVVVRSCRRSPASYGFDTVVLGSAVQKGHHWLPKAIDYLKAEAPDLAERPTWLFQTGPCADGEAEGHVGATPAPLRVLQVVRNIGAAGPATFSRPDDSSTGEKHPQRWVATGPCFGPFGADDGVGTWARMISDFAVQHPVRDLDEELLPGARRSPQPAAAS